MPIALRAATRRSLLVALVVALFSGLAPAPAALAQAPSVRIGAEEDPTDASIAMSQATFAGDQVPYVVLGRNDLFPDNLVGAALTGGTGPLLLVDPAPAGLRASVVEEIERTLPPSGDCADVPPNVYVLGGTAAVGEAVVADLRDRGYCVERLSGPTRVETAIAVASEMLQAIFASQDDPTTGTRGPIMLARDDNPADSSSAGAYAAASFVPIVVSPGDQLHPAVADLLQPGDTAWEEVTLLGGRAALSDEVLEQARRAAAGDQGFDVPTNRIAGATRDDTAFKIANELWSRRPSPPDTAMIVNGFDNPDFWQYALPAGAVGGALGAPELFVFTDSIPDPTDVYLRQTPLERLLTIGPTSEISEATRQAAESSLGSGA